ncbi:TolC family protein [Rhodopirellula sp. SWK7]|uniref:TolC family protein n=1 Tax=Rhodopirellula sp. SWK7 TaxID=595460 RepID=UPI0002BE90ED|nr:TolC family protein [Rhodopirellula sp. SWK7]EMI42047.1 outer membrane efflux family protein [Rhodopirellula sp. SWK7]
MESAYHAKRLAFTGLLILTATGCGIPGLRRAQPGAALPSDYQWNNGRPFSDTDVETLSNVPALPTSDVVAPVHVRDLDANDESNLGSANQDNANVQGEKAGPSISFANFIRAASFTPERSQDALTPSPSDVEPQSLQTLLGSTGDSTVAPVADDSMVAGESIDLPETVQSVASVELIDTNIGPSDSPIDVMSFSNSAQLPHSMFFSDPYLLGLITETLMGNQKLKILSEEIRIACNETYARSGEYRPFVSLGATAGFEKSGRHTRDGAVEDQLDVANGRSFPDPLGDFGVGANVSWELDIWHRLRNSQRAAAMRYLGTQEGRNYIVTRVVAEVAENYYQLLALDNRLSVLQATIDIQRKSLDVSRAKKSAGRGTELAVQRFEAEVQKNLSERSLIEQEIVEVENRINFLAGRYPQPIERTNVELTKFDLNTLGAGVPSELLLNRADIREAERQVAAAGLDVRVARAKFYPSLSLTAGLGWNAFSTGYLFRTPESLVYGLAGELVGPLINKRAIKADYCSANAAQLQAIYNYQQTVLQAHIEVVNQITKVENYRRSVDVKLRQLEALQASVDAANDLFQNARAEYVEVLLAQRELMEAKMLLIDTKKEQLAAIINAYQALGGGAF